MSLGGATWPLAAILIVLPLAGCIAPGGAEDTFDEVSVPVWEPGFDWTYDVTTTERSSYAGDAGQESREESHTAELILDVFNTTEPFGEEAAYYVRHSQPMDHPLLGPSYQAFAQDDLSLIGVAFDWYEKYAYAEPVPMYAYDRAYVESPPRYDPCDGRPVMDEADSEEQPPGVTFPLVAGSTRSGTWGNDGFGFAYRYRVRSLEQVTTPAGAFEAVHVAVTLIPQQNEDGFAGEGFRATFDYWYAPEARQVVKSVVTATSDNLFQEGSFEYEAVQELTAFDLTPAEAEPAPVRRSEQIDYSYVMRQIVSDVQLPANIAEGPVGLTLALFEDAEGMGHHQYDSSYDPSIQAMDPLPETLSLDPSKYQVAWAVRDQYTYELIAEGTGYQFPVTLDRGGNFQVSADIQPLECGLPWLGSYYGTAATFWERTVDVQNSQSASLPGLVPAETAVMEFPVSEGAVLGTARWTSSSPLVTPTAEGMPRVYDPDGQEAASWGGDSRTVEFMPYVRGDWTVTWDPNTPIALQQNVRITLRVDYAYVDETHRH